MRYLLLGLAAAFALGLANVPATRAFDIQVDGMANADGSAKFADPDEQFEALAGGETGGPVHIFKFPAVHLAPGKDHPLESVNSVPWTAERIRLVFGPYAH